MGSGSEPGVVGVWCRKKCEASISNGAREKMEKEGNRCAKSDGQVNSLVSKATDAEKRLSTFLGATRGRARRSVDETTTQKWQSPLMLTYPRLK